MYIVWYIRFRIFYICLRMYMEMIAYTNKYRGNYARVVYMRVEGREKWFCFVRLTRIYVYVYISLN